jgi:hypothetical protein
VWNGGASNEKVRELYERQRRRDEEKMVKRRSRGSGKW